MKPLKGVKVLELGTNVAVPSAARILEALGATIIKLEPQAGDIMRTQGPAMNMSYSDEENAAFDMVAANKNFLSVDLKHSEGIAALYRMLETMDVLVTSYRNKALAKLGLSYEVMKEKFPRVIYAHLSGFGEEGPEAGSPGYDTTAYLARGGVMHALPEKGTSPINTPVAYGDFQASVCLANGICAALYAREKTGKGDKITVSLHHTALYMMTAAVVSSQFGNEVPKTRKDTPNPLNNSFPTREGRWFQMCLPNYERDSVKLFKMLGLNEMAEKPEYTTLLGLLEHKTASAVVEAVETETRKMALDDIVTKMKENDLSCEKAYNMEEILADEQAWANGCFTKVNYPSGEKILTTVPIRMESIFSEGEGTVQKTKPVGSDTMEILASFGFSDDEITKLREQGAIYCG